jgi:hypothetical protein
VPNWPISVGSLPPAAAGSGLADAGFVAPFEVACASAWLAEAQKSAAEIKAVSIPRTDIAESRPLLL